ncbi:MAG: ribonuclease HII [Candidatus Hodarchaeota archaeon]
MKLKMGADEAGRGPVLGPLVICAALFSDECEDQLVSCGVDDSKKLTSKKREQLAKIIKEKAIDFEIVSIPAKKIDAAQNKGINLNDLEVIGFVKAINRLLERNGVPDCIWLDAADVNPQRFEEKIKKKLKENVDIVASHKGDEKFTCVGAASILAKTHRDSSIQDLCEKYGDIGSGYPGDPKTRQFLKDYYKEHNKFPPFARKCWDTLKKLEKEMGIRPKGQAALF